MERHATNFARVLIEALPVFVGCLVPKGVVSVRCLDATLCVRETRPPELKHLGGSGSRPFADGMGGSTAYQGAQGFKRKAPICRGPVPI